MSGIPGNFITHRAAWREAIEIAKTHAKGADVSYWVHELAAFDRSFDRLWALMQAAPAEQQAAPKDHELRELVNRLRDVALNFHDSQQLRERIAAEILPMRNAQAAPPPESFQWSMYEP